MPTPRAKNFVDAIEYLNTVTKPTASDFRLAMWTIERLNSAMQSLGEQLSDIDNQWQREQRCSMDSDMIERATDMYKRGASTTIIAKSFGVSRTTVHKTLKQNGVRMRPRR